MRNTIRSLVVLGLVASASISLEGQVARRRPLPPIAQIRPGVAIARERVAERRIIMQERVRAMRQAGARTAARRAIVRRQMMRNQIRQLTPAQRQQLQTSRQALRTERQRIGAEFRKGSITREQARQSMQSWRREHRPNLGLRGPRRPGGGEF